MATGPKTLYEFGPFRLDPERQQLLRESQPIAITPKAFETLLILVRNSREVVSKEDLMKALWPDAFVEEANLSQNIFMLRKALGDTPEDRRYIVTLPGHGYRFASEVRTITRDGGDLVIASHTRSELVLEQTGRSPEAGVATMPELSAGARRKFNWKYAASICALITLGIGAGVLLRSRRPAALSAKDTVLIADFTNTTGDAVFDDTLRQGLSVQLEQSPFLSLVSDQHIQQTLRLMAQPADARLTPEIALDLCQRTQSAAVISGSISHLGSQYVLGLKAVSCHTGDVLAEEQETASGKETVLRALDQAAVILRQRLGESLSSVAKFDTPLEEATTPLLEALQAYTTARKMMVGKNEPFEALPFFERAIQLDPNFAMAYAAMGADYFNLGETALGTASIRKAYELHAPVSQFERGYIESSYYHLALGDLEKARQVYEISGQTYPRYSGIPLRLYFLYSQLGQYDKALAQIREAIRLDPSRAINYGGLVETYIALNRLADAKAAAEQVQAKQLDSSGLRLILYGLAFLEGDSVGMSEQLNSLSTRHGVEGRMLELQAEVAAYSGRLKEAKELSERATESAIHTHEKENAASFAANDALRNALMANSEPARADATRALALSNGRAVQYAAALSLALSGDTVRAQALADDLAKRFPDDTIVNFNYLPTIRGQIVLGRKNSPRAIELLQAATPYEFGRLGSSLEVVYVRGEAYLAAHRGAEATAEFQKILDHRGVVGTNPIGALAHLQLGRAYVLAGDKAKAKSAYQDFLQLWKDADPDIPILKQARSEYAKLQ